MITPDATTLATLGTISVAVTQLSKDLGISGEWLKVVCLASAVVLGYVMIFQPALWSALVLPLVGVTGTGGVSLLDDFVQKLGASQQG
jgi:hypothetical protein